MQNGALVATVWCENKRRNPVRMSSAMFSPNLPIESVKRKQQNCLNKDVPYPKPVVEYNKFMGGVDLSNQLRVEFRTARNAKRWWTYVFYFLFDLKSDCKGLLLFIIMADIRISLRNIGGQSMQW